MGLFDAVRDKIYGWDPAHQEDTHTNQPKPRPQLVSQDPPREES